MIGVCTKCCGMFETTEEDAFTPGTLCPDCYHPLAEERAAADEQARAEEQADVPTIVDEF